MMPFADDRTLARSAAHLTFGNAMRKICFTVLLCGTAFGADISVGVGAGFSTSSVNTPGGLFTGSSGSVATLVDGGFKIAGFGPISVNGDVPLLFGGPAHASVAASKTGAAAYVEHIGFVMTPGLKARLNLGLIAPWASFGLGVGRLDGSAVGYALGSTGVATAQDRWSFAFSPAGGVDFKPLPFLFFRGEVRRYTFRTPDTIAGLTPLQDPNWRSNMLFIASVGVRF